MQTVWTGYDLNIYRTTPVAAFALSFSIRKELKKKKVSEIDSTLISLFHVQIQEPASSSTTTKAFVFLQILLIFIITKYLKPEMMMI